MPTACPDKRVWQSQIRPQRTGNAEPKPSPALELAFVHCKREKRAHGGEPFDFARVGMMSHMTQAINGSTAGSASATRVFGT